MQSLVTFSCQSNCYTRVPGNLSCFCFLRKVSVEAFEGCPLFNPVLLSCTHFFQFSPGITIQTCVKEQKEVTTITGTARTQSS